MADNQVDVLCFVGAARSGSTVLGAMIGAHQSAVCVGELGFFRKAVPFGERQCACGSAAADCLFWSRIFKLWGAGSFAEQCDRYERISRPFKRRRSLLRVIGEQRRRSEAFERFSEDTYRLFRSISEAAGGVAVVDTSKDPVRGLALSLVPGLRVHYIHLVRDGRGVVWSLVRRKHPRGDPAPGLRRGSVVLRSSAYWAGVTWLSDYVVRRSGAQGTLVRYEDYVANPNVTLEQIWQQFGFQSTGADWAHGDGSAVDFGHMLGGNVVRLRGRVGLQSDDSWRRSLTPTEQSLFWWVAGRAAKRYGYVREWVQGAGEAAGLPSEAGRK